MAEAVFPIRSGDYRAEVVSTGAGLRMLERQIGGQPWALTETWGNDGGPPMSAGLVLAPWPNRTAHGRFGFAGVEHYLEVTEPARDNAIHGLVRQREWTIDEHAEHRVLASLEVGLPHGWPFPLRLTVAYEVGQTGLRVTTSATNIGSVPAPYGFGMHPFIRAGDAELDSCTLQLPAGVRLPLDPDLMTPVGLSIPVSGTDHDFTRPRALRDVWLDTPFSALLSDRDGLVRAVLRPPAGPPTVIWAEPRFRWLQVFTAEEYPGRGRALAVEPMTCPPDALNSNIDLIVLEPGEVWGASWGIQCG